MWRTICSKILSSKKKNPKLFIGIFSVFMILMVAVVAFVVVPHMTLAQTTTQQSTTDSSTADNTTSGETDVNAFARVLGWIFLAIASLLGKLLLVIIEILVGLMQYNDFINAPAVTTGWYIIRDVSNMFFIMILLVIAFSTILKIERFTYNKLLVRLIIMAVLINFSKAIAGFVIDVAQVIMMTFVNAFKNVAAGNFTSILQLQNMLNGLSNRSGTEPIASWEYLTATIFAMAMLAIAVLVMIAMVIVFLMRIIMLWILVVLSPFAYIMNVLPGKMQSYASQWWSKFFQWVTIGPILAFFIWLALTILSSNTNNFGVEVLQKGEGGSALSTSGGATQLLGATVTSISRSDVLLSFIIAIAMLCGSLLVAQSLGGVAGGMAGNILGRIKKGGMGAFAPVAGVYKAARFGVKKEAAFVGKKLDLQQMKLQQRAGLKTPMSFRPSVIKEAFSSWGSQRDREKYDVARGTTQDLFHRVFSKQKTDYGQRAKRRMEQDEEGKILSNKDSELEFGFKQAQEKKNKFKMAAHLRRLAKQGDLDNVVRNLGYKTTIDGSDNDYHAFLRKELVEKGGFDLQDAYRVGEDIGQLAEANGQYGLSRSLGYDLDKGEFYELSPDVWAATVAAQQSKRDPQVIARNNHRTAYVGETRVWQKSDGTVVNNKAEVEDDLMKLRQARSTVATDEEREEFDAKIKKMDEGMLADLGFHSAGELTFSGMDPQHAGRVQPNAIASIMFNNAEKAKQLNPEMYKALWQQLMVLNPEQLKKLENNAFKVVREENGKLVIKDHAQLKSAALGVTWEEVSAGGKSGLKEKVIQEAIKSGVAKDKEDKEAIHHYYDEHYLNAPHATGATPTSSVASQKYSTAQKLDQEAADKRQDSRTKRNEADELEKTAEREYAESTGEDKDRWESAKKKVKAEKLRVEANKLDTEAQAAENKAQIIKSEAAADEMEDVLTKADSQKLSQVSISSGSIKSIASAIEESLSDITGSAGGIEITKFNDALKKNISDLTQVMNKLPNSFKGKVPNELMKLQQMSQEGRFKTQEEQREALLVLRHIQYNLEKISGQSQSGPQSGTDDDEETENPAGSDMNDSVND